MKRKEKDTPSKEPASKKSCNEDTLMETKKLKKSAELPEPIFPVDMISNADEKFLPISQDEANKSGNILGIDDEYIMQIDCILWKGISLWKIPFHTVGKSQQRFVRVRQSEKDLPGISVEIKTDESTENHRENVSYPLALELTNLDNAKKKPSLKEFRIQDMLVIKSGQTTQAFRAYKARYGNDAVPQSNRCFSIIGLNRTVDFYAGSLCDAQTWIKAINNIIRQLKSDICDSMFKPIYGISNVNSVKRTWDPSSHEDLLFATVKSGNVRDFVRHMENGCPIDYMQQSKLQDTPLIAACRLGKPDIVQVALRYDAKNDPHPKFGQTALQVAVSAGHTSCVRLLLETAECSAVDVVIVNHEDSSKEAPIHIASRCGNQSLLKLLIHHGANINLVDGLGRTSLHCAAEGGHEKCLVLLLDSGGEELLEERDDNGFTCLHIAIKSNRLRCVRNLLQIGADTKAITLDGFTAFDIATNHKFRKMQSLLVTFMKESPSKLPRPHNKHIKRQKEKKQKKVEMFHGLDQYTVSCDKMTRHTACEENYNRTTYSERSALIDEYSTPVSTRTHRVNQPMITPNHVRNMNQFDSQFNTHNSGSLVVRHPEENLSQINCNEKQCAIQSNSRNVMSPYWQDENLYSSFKIGNDVWYIIIHITGHLFYQRERDNYSQV